MPEYFASIDEVIHCSASHVGASDIYLSIEEGAAASDSSLQHYDFSVDELSAAADNTDAEMDPRRWYMSISEASTIVDAFTAVRVRRWTDDLGTHNLNRSGTNPEPLERALADLEAGILMDIDVELIIDTWDAYATQLKNLPFLAWAYDVDIWEDGWSEWTQREWVDRQHEFKSIRGTIGAIEMALDFAGRDYVGYPGYELRQSITPPQGFFFPPGLTVEEHNAWLRLMPQIRIYLGSEQGDQGADFFWDDGFHDGDEYIAFDNGWELYGRKAILRQKGHDDVPLLIKQRSDVTSTYETRDWEEIRVRGKSVSGLFWDDDFFNLESSGFFSSEEVAPKTFNVTLNRSFDRVSTELHLSAVRPTQQPIDVTYERDSDIGQIGDLLFWDHEFWGDGIVEEDNAPLMLADRLYLYDPDIATPMSVGVSFWDLDRFGFPNHTMELLIDLKTKGASTDGWWGQTFWEEFFWEETDLSHVDRACRAVVAAKSLRDKALVQFDPWRPLRSADLITEDTRTGDWVPNNL